MNRPFAIEDAVEDLVAAHFAEARAARAEVIRLRRRAEVLGRAHDRAAKRPRGKGRKTSVEAQREEDLRKMISRLDADLTTAEVAANLAAAAWRRARDEAPILEARIRRTRAAALVAVGEPAL